MNVTRIRHIQSEYVALIDAHYTDERHALGNAPDEDIPDSAFVDSGRILVPKAGRALSVAEFKAESFRDAVRDFWDQRTTDLLEALGDDTGLSTCVWGDMDVSAVARRFGVYFDTVFLPDLIPYYAAPERIGLSPSAYARDYVSWTCAIDSLRGLLLAEADPPILIVCPARFGRHFAPTVDDADKSDALSQYAHQLTYYYLSEGLGVEAEEPNDFALCLAAMRGSGDVVERFAHSDVLGLVGMWLEQRHRRPSMRGPEYDGLETRLRDRTVVPSDLPQLFGLVYTQFYLLEAREANAALVGADTALSEAMWEASRRRNACLARWVSARAASSEKEIVASSFQNRFGWLDNLSDAEIVASRSRRGLVELRDLLRVDRQLLRRASVDDYAAVAAEYEAAVTSRLMAFSAELLKMGAELSRRRARSLVSCGVSAALGAASLALPHLLLLSILAAGYGTVVGGASIKDLVEQFVEGRRSLRAAGERPIALLLDAYQESKV